MQFKKFNGTTWETVRHKIYGSGTDSLTAFPAMIQASGEPLTDYTISGNTFQDGTPTPQAPVDVVGCGERTGNLFDKDATDTSNGYVVNKYLTSSGDTTSSTLYNISEYIELSPSTVYTVFIGSAPKNPCICFYDANKNYIEGIAYDLMDTITVTTPANAKYCRVSYLNTLGAVVMLNVGSTALPYEPYGYKIPITCGGETNNIYLGQVETTRKIKKYEFTGQENISLYNGSNTRVGFSLTIGDAVFNGRVTGICSHFTPQMTPYSSTIDGITFGAYDKNFYFTFSSNSVSTYTLTDIASIKAWLTAQYAAGEPVTVWYVLAEQETGIVNEPLHRIGGYADTISFAQAEVAIPTSDGDNIISFGTAVQPSAMSAAFKGWHPVQGAKQYDGSEWR